MPYMKYLFTKEIAKKFKSIKKIPKFLQEYPEWDVQVKTLREVFGMTQQQLGRKIHSTGRIIRKIESQEIHPNLETLRKIASALESDLKIFMVPKKPVTDILDEKSLQKAKQIVGLTQGSSAMELQAPSPEAIDQQIKQTQEKIFSEQRQLLWNEP